MKDYSALTEREKEVKKLIFKGLNNTEIANTIFVSKHTAKAHVCNILHKLGLRNRYELFIYEIEQLKSKITSNSNNNVIYLYKVGTDNNDKRFFKIS